MDLLAYLNKEEIEEIMKKNSIEIPRFRGGYLTSSTEKLPDEAFKNYAALLKETVYVSACTSEPRFRPNSPVHEYSSATDKMKKKYLTTKTETWTDEDGTEYSIYDKIDFNWNLVHGKNKKAIKLAIKQGEKALSKFFLTYNKYAGKENVLCIHARIGGNNWAFYGGSDIERQPWFLEKIDDYFDNTYCNIYVKIKEEN